MTVYYDRSHTKMSVKWRNQKEDRRALAILPVRWVSPIQCLSGDG